MMKKIVGCIAFLLIISLGIFEANRIFTPKWDDELYATCVCEGLYAEENLDVVFFGTSQVIYGISPMELYEKYGIKAYDCATGAQSMVSTYYWTKEVIDKKHPKVLVIDIYDVIYDDLAGDENIRQSLDYMQMGKNKLQAACDVTDCYEIDSDVISFVLPALRYHDRWQQLGKKDFTYQFGDKTFYTKGFIGGTEVADFPYEGIDFATIDRTASESFLSDHLKMILDYCKETDTKVVLTKVPIGGYAYPFHNLIQTIADEYEVPFIDMVSSDVWAEAGIDSTTDFIGLPHLNISGAIKTTEYLGNYLVENYPEVLENSEKNLSDERWQQELKAYQTYRKECLEQIDSARN